MAKNPSRMAIKGPQGPSRPHGKKVVNPLSAWQKKQSAMQQQGCCPNPSNTHSGAALPCSTAVFCHPRHSPEGEGGAICSPEPFAPAFAFLSSLVREVLAALLAQSIINP